MLWSVFRVIIIILARELESVKSPGLASPFLVSFKDGFMMSEKSLNDESLVFDNFDFTKKILVYSQFCLTMLIINENLVNWQCEYLQAKKNEKKDRN